MATGKFRRIGETFRGRNKHQLLMDLHRRLLNFWLHKHIDNLCNKRFGVLLFLSDNKILQRKIKLLNYKRY